MKRLISLMLFISLCTFSGFAQNNNNVDLSDEIYQIICEAEETPLFSVSDVYSGSNHDLQKAVLSSMMSVNTKYGSIDLIKDYNNYLEIITLAINISESEDSNVLNTLLENSDQIVSIIKDSKTIPVLMPLVVEVVRLSNEDINIDFDDLLELDWSEEIDNFADVLESIFDGLDDLDFDVENIESGQRTTVEETLL